MQPLKRLFSAHTLIFLLLGLTIILDLTGVMSSIMPGTSFALGSILVIAYFLGVSGIIRFGLARRPIHLALNLVISVVLYLGWFVIQAAFNDSQYRPSMLFVLCVVAAFKTMRFRDISPATAAETSTRPQEGDETP